MVVDVNIPILINRFYMHDQLKDQLLTLIESAQSDEERADDSITNTDWNLNLPLGQPDYQQLLMPHILAQSQKTFNRGSALQLTDMWFQQYQKGDTHGWHVHDSCHWANVYFLELPSKDSKTQILDLNRNEIEYEAEEGDIISFPSMLLHRSKPNLLLDRKTIIAYNINFTHVRDCDP